MTVVRLKLVTLLSLAMTFLHGRLFIEAKLLLSPGTINPELRYRPLKSDFDENYRLKVTHGKQVINDTLTKTGHYTDITLTVNAFNETFLLDLAINRYLFASNYIEKAITVSGEIYNRVNHVTHHCYYIGKVRGQLGSSAAVSTCKGIVGYFTTGNISYHIEPQTENLLGKHRIFRNRGDTGAKFKCGMDDELRRFSADFKTSSRSGRRLKRSFRWPQDLPRRIKVVEVYIANDNSQYIARGSNVDNVYSRTKSIVNVASTAYQAVDIVLVLVGVEVWTDVNRISIQATNSSSALNDWCTYRMIHINPYHYNDNAALITNTAFGVVVGKGYVGSMCSNQLSASVISDVSVQLAAAGSTLAHEMGHNFGLQHDDAYVGCSCSDSATSNRCIMYPETSFNRPATQWSSCSRSALASSFQQGLDICLYNVPETIFQASSTCGNGIVEKGEQCDCGNTPSDECNRMCCNSTTCRLASSATCAFGGCCDISRCQMKSSGTQCRSKTNDCDNAEFCNGVDFLCPADTYQPDGTSCTNGDAAYCYGGQCNSHLSQCQLIWGSGTNVSSNNCYSRLNVDGLHYGNCGMNWTPNVTFIPCRSSDVMCGKLQCQNNSRSLSYYQNFYLTSTASIGSSTCHSVIFDYGLGVQDPGLVPNGAKCGDGKMCVNQRCVDVQTIRSPLSSTSASTRRTTSSPSSSSSSSSSSSTTTTTTTATTTTESSTSPELNTTGSKPMKNNYSDHPYSLGLIIGVTVAGAIVVFLTVATIFALCVRHKKKNSNKTISRNQAPVVTISDGKEMVSDGNRTGFANLAFYVTAEPPEQVLSFHPPSHLTPPKHPRPRNSFNSTPGKPFPYDPINHTISVEELKKNFQPSSAPSPPHLSGAKADNGRPIPPAKRKDPESSKDKKMTTASKPSPPPKPSKSLF